MDDDVNSAVGFVVDWWLTLIHDKNQDICPALVKRYQCVPTKDYKKRFNSAHHCRLTTGASSFSWLRWQILRRPLYHISSHIRWGPLPHKVLKLQSSDPYFEVTYLWKYVEMGDANGWCKHGFLMLFGSHLEQLLRGSGGRSPKPMLGSNYSDATMDRKWCFNTTNNQEVDQQ